MKINYKMIKELCEQSNVVRIQLMKQQIKDGLKQLDNFITEIQQLFESNDKFIQTDEVMSDLEWIEFYYKKREWNNVTRWLTNIDSS